MKVLSWASLAYMTLEGTIAILAGVLAGSVADESPSFFLAALACLVADREGSEVTARACG